MDNVIVSPFESIDIPQKTILQYIQYTFGPFVDNKAVICCETERSYTFGEVSAKSLCLATNVIDKNVYGLACGDIVSIILPNVPEYVLILVACLRAGLVVAPVQILLDKTKFSEDRSNKVMRYLVMSQMCYNFGITNILVQLIMGYTLMCIPEFSMSKYLEAIEKFQPTVLQMLPFAIHHVNTNKNVTDKQLESVKLIITGGSCIGSLTLKKISEKFPHIKIVSGYAMTETCGPNMSRMLKVHSADSVGVLLANTEARVADPESGANLGPNSLGELYIRGPQVTRGYFRNPSATAEALDEDGWLHTGDMAYYDDNQEFFVTDRVSDYIKVDGKLVSPTELEDLLRGHPSIKDVAVVPIENRIHGQVPKAYVVLQLGCDYYDHNLLHKYLEDKVEEHQKLLGGISVLEFIPKSFGGKVNKVLLKQMSHSRFE